MKRVDRILSYLIIVVILMTTGPLALSQTDGAATAGFVFGMILMLYGPVRLIMTRKN